MSEIEFDVAVERLHGGYMATGAENLRRQMAYDKSLRPRIMVKKSFGNSKENYRKRFR